MVAFRRLPNTADESDCDCPEKSEREEAKWPAPDGEEKPEEAATVENDVTRTWWRVLVV